MATPKRSAPKKTATKKPASKPAKTSRGDVPASKSNVAPNVASPSGLWLIKSEPSAYPWSQLVREGQARWDGVRNFEARNNLRAMKRGDFVLFYHSSEGLEVVGIARVKTEAYKDPTDPGDWSAVDIEPAIAIHKPVSLSALKAEVSLRNLAFLRKPRLSVSPVSTEEFATILRMGQTPHPKP